MNIIDYKSEIIYRVPKVRIEVMIRVSVRVTVRVRVRVRIMVRVRVYSVHQTLNSVHQAINWIMITNSIM